MCKRELRRAARRPGTRCCGARWPSRRARWARTTRTWWPSARCWTRRTERAAAGAVLCLHALEGRMTAARACKSLALMHLGATHEP